MKLQNMNTLSVDAASKDMFTKAVIDQSDMEVALNMLSVTYKNPIRAVLRELITNGIDALREAGLDPSYYPVEVTLPDMLENTGLTITDYGCGMDRQRLQRAFGQFVSSTKRDSNDEHGGFGIGAKSPFAVSDAYQAQTAVFDPATGIQKVNHIICSYLDGTPSFMLLDEVTNIVDTKDLDEDEIVKLSYTTVSVTPRDDLTDDSWDRELEQLIQDMTGPYVECTNRDRLVEYARAIKADDIMDDRPGLLKAFIATYGRAPIIHNHTRSFRRNLIGRIGHPKVMVRMGEVVYEGDDLTNRYSERRTTLDLPIGSIPLPPSREAIIVTDTTRKLVRDLVVDEIKRMRRVIATTLKGQSFEQQLMTVKRLLNPSATKQYLNELQAYRFKKDDITHNLINRETLYGDQDLDHSLAIILDSWLYLAAITALDAGQLERAITDYSDLNVPLETTVYSPESQVVETGRLMPDIVQGAKIALDWIDALNNVDNQPRVLDHLCQLAKHTLIDKMLVCDITALPQVYSRFRVTVEPNNWKCRDENGLWVEGYGLHRATNVTSALTKPDTMIIDTDSVTKSRLELFVRWWRKLSNHERKNTNLMIVSKGELRSNAITKLLSELEVLDFDKLKFHTNRDLIDAMKGESQDTTRIPIGDQMLRVSFAGVLDPETKTVGKLKLSQVVDELVYVAEHGFVPVITKATLNLNSLNVYEPRGFINEHWVCNMWSQSYCDDDIRPSRWLDKVTQVVLMPPLSDGITPYIMPVTLEANGHQMKAILTQVRKRTGLELLNLGLYSKAQAKNGEKAADLNKKAWDQRHRFIKQVLDEPDKYSIVSKRLAAMLLTSSVKASTYNGHNRRYHNHAITRYMGLSEDQLNTLDKLMLNTGAHSKLRELLLDPTSNLSPINAAIMHEVVAYNRQRPQTKIDWPLYYGSQTDQLGLGLSPFMSNDKGDYYCNIYPKAIKMLKVLGAVAWPADEIKEVDPLTGGHNVPAAETTDRSTIAIYRYLNEHRDANADQLLQVLTQATAANLLTNRFVSQLGLALKANHVTIDPSWENDDSIAQLTKQIVETLKTPKPEQKG